MTFFNRKEEVIDIQLTQYGKYVFSQGEFKPTYYAFFDDDILYDGKYVDLTEDQNTIKNRIEEAVRPKTQYVFEGIETTITHNNKLIRNELSADLIGNRFGAEYGMQSPQTRNYAMALPIGNSDFLTEKTPAWSISFLKGALSSSQDHIGWPTSSLSDIGLANIKIPQLETKIQYETKVILNPLAPSNTTAIDDPLAEITDSVSEDPNLAFEEETFNDGTSFKIKENYIILECKEENAPFLKDNFDIEVFEITSSTGPAGNKKELLLPLWFVKPRPPNIVNDILIDVPDVPLNEQTMRELIPVYDSNYIEHYFHIYVDREIDTEVICNLIDVKKDKNTQLLDVYDCPKEATMKTIRTKTPIDVYETPGGLMEEDLEDC